MSWAPDLGHKLLNTILLAKKYFEVFWRKVGWPSKIIVNKKVFDLANMIKNQYVIQLAEKSKPVIVNQVIALTIKTQHAQMGHLGYRFLLKLPKLVNKIETNGSATTKNCGKCMNGLLQQKPF